MTGPALDFWSRRKAQVAEEAAREAEPPVAPETRSDEEILAAFDLPDPDTLTLGDDIRGFMAKAVPAHLRRRALRQLWRTNPVLACVDGLNDYDGDFTDQATVRAGMQTAYQIGKGMMAHVQEVARQAEALVAEPAAELPADAEVPEVLAESTPAPEPVASAEADTPPTPRRRMRISYAADESAEVGA